MANYAMSLSVSLYPRHLKKLQDRMGDAEANLSGQIRADLEDFWALNDLVMRSLRKLFTVEEIVLFLASQTDAIRIPGQINISEITLRLTNIAEDTNLAADLEVNVSVLLEKFHSLHPWQVFSLLDFAGSYLARHRQPEVQKSMLAQFKRDACVDLGKLKSFLNPAARS